MSNCIAIQKKFMLNLYANRGLAFSRGDGVHLITDEGDRYLDMMSNYGVNILGYNHPLLNEALTRQLQALPSLHCSFSNDTRAIASRLLVQRISRPQGQVYWSNSGTEAVEAALKLAVLASGRRKFVACRNGYHGKTLGALSATDGGKYRRAFEPLLWHFTHVPFDDLCSLEEALDDQTAAFLVEPIQGEGGVHVPSDGYLRSAKQLCAGYGALLILDEVQTGVGRTGTFLASARDGVEADIICLGKGLGGGVPIGATLVSSEIAGHAFRSAHSSTFGGNPLACAGVHAVLNYLTDAALSRIADLGVYFRKGLLEIGDDRIRAVKGRGLMVGIAVGDLRDDILKGLQREKVLAIPAGSDVVRFLPPYIVDRPHMEQALDALRSVLKRLP